ncbi:MAG: class I SAM-dependent methyltransferase [Luteimonas sp.]
MPADRNDDALETLFLPIVNGALSWPQDGALFLRARDGWPLHRQALPGLVCEQSFKPDVDALLRSGLDAHPPGDRPDQLLDQRLFPLVLVLPPRQRDEARALFAQALARLRPGGTIVACSANDEGAKSAEADLARIAGPLNTLSKNKCRVFWTAPLTDGASDDPLAAQWLALDVPRAIGDGRFRSRPGIFAWDRVDTASALLAAHLPDDLAGHAADLGAGYGYLSAELLRRCPGIRALDVFEAEARALALARENLAAFETRAAIDMHWHDVTAGLPRTYDVIVTNPPFHASHRTERPDIGRRFIAIAAAALVPGGRLWLVANRHLPYEAVLDAHFGSVRTMAQAQGFKIVEAVKALPIKTRAAKPFDKASLRRLG